MPEGYTDVNYDLLTANKQILLTGKIWKQKEGGRKAI